MADEEPELEEGHVRDREGLDRSVGDWLDDLNDLVGAVVPGVELQAQLPQERVSREERPQAAIARGHEDTVLPLHDVPVVLHCVQLVPCDLARGHRQFAADQDGWPPFSRWPLRDLEFQLIQLAQLLL